MFKLYLLIIPLLLITPFVAQAQKAPACPIYSTSGNAGIFKDVNCVCVEIGDCSADDFVIVVFNIVEKVFGAAGVIALLFFIMGGVFLLISGGNQNFIARGKLILRSALIGLAIIFLSWIIVNLIVIGITGNTDATIFNKDEWYILKT